MMSDVEWNNESVIRLIEEYKRRRELWDKNHDLYRVQTAKYEAWASMARIFECDIADLRKKFNSVLASHRREKAKIRGGGRSTWFLYQYLNFLTNHLEQPDDEEETIQTRTRGIPQLEYHMDENATSDEDANDFEEPPVTIKKEPVVQYARTKRAPPLRNSKRLIRTVKRKVVREAPSTPPSKSHVDTQLVEVVRLLRKTIDNSKKKDDCGAYGDYVAESLRKHDERTQSMIKQAMNNILFEQEMKKYSTGQFTVVIADENPLILGEDGSNS